MSINIVLFETKIDFSSNEQQQKDLSLLCAHLKGITDREPSRFFPMFSG